jgi:DNA-binding winged helix-turn-helix (wHTH) protein
MTSGRFRFASFELDPGDRRLTCDGAPVELSARYLDALLLLANEQGRLVTKDRFHEEVWRGIPVTDEALTQCITTLRRRLGDEASRPRFIETVPKHGYRFIAPVEWVGADGHQTAAAALDPSWREFFALAGAGTAGGGVAGLAGGLLYGFTAAAQPGVGSLSVLLVLTFLSFGIALLGAAGVSLGIAAAGFATGYRWLWSVVGGAGGGMLVGAAFKLLGLDAFNLLVGQTPGDIAGAPEGLLLGGAVGLGAWLAASGSLRRAVAIAMALGGLAGVAISLLGGRLMLGSLDVLARSFPGSQLRLEPIGALFGERGLGPVGQSVSGGLEGALFGGCVVAAMLLARRRLGAKPEPLAG